MTLPIVGSSSVLKFDLGDFFLTTTDSRVVSQPNGFKYVQETIRITSDGIRADRSLKIDSYCFVFIVMNVLVRRGLCLCDSYITCQFRDYKYFVENNGLLAM